jgi:hypothetical protein
MDKRAWRRGNGLREKYEYVGKVICRVGLPEESQSTEIGFALAGGLQVLRRIFCVKVSLPL